MLGYGYAATSTYCANYGMRERITEAVSAFEISFKVYIAYFDLDLYQYTFLRRMITSRSCLRWLFCLLRIHQDVYHVSNLMYL